MFYGGSFCDNNARNPLCLHLRLGHQATSQTMLLMSNLLLQYLKHLMLSIAQPLSPCQIRYDAALKACVRIAVTKASSFRNFLGLTGSGFGLIGTSCPHSGQPGQVEVEY